MESTGLNKVWLHVYDLSQGLAKKNSKKLVNSQIDGVWHTGIVAYDKEFYYGGGISFDMPGRTPFGQPSEKIPLGETEVPEELFMELLKELLPRFNQQNYKVFQNNCNNFTDEVCQIILGRGIPDIYYKVQPEFLNTNLSRQLEPLMLQVQTSLKMSSNEVFPEESQQSKAPSMVLKSAKQAQEQARQEQIHANIRPTGNAQMDQFMQQLAHMQNQRENRPDQQMEASQQQQQQAPQNLVFPEPVHGEVMRVTQLAHLQKIIKDYPGVVIDFWGSKCGPCMRFKPLYESTARINPNKKIVFVAVETDQAREICISFQVRSIPQFNFFLNGEETKKFVGANEIQFRQALGELYDGLSSQANQHMSMQFKQFKPQNKMPVGFTSAGQADKMRSVIQQFLQSEQVTMSTVAKGAFAKWLTIFDLKEIDSQALSELVYLLSVAQDKQQMALTDLLRLLIIQDSSANDLVGSLWNSLNSSLIEKLTNQNIKEPQNKVLHNLHMLTLKMLSNIYQTNKGRDLIQDSVKSSQIIAFAQFSFGSCNQKTVYHAALLLFNHLLCYEKDSKKEINPQLESIFKSLDELNNDQTIISDEQTSLSIILCECRMLYTNVELCTWVEEHFKMFFTDSHKDLQQRSQFQTVKQAIDDLMSMVTLQ